MKIISFTPAVGAYEYIRRKTVNWIKRFFTEVMSRKLIVCYYLCMLNFKLIGLIYAVLMRDFNFSISFNFQVLKLIFVNLTEFNLINRFFK